MAEARNPQDPAQMEHNLMVLMFNEVYCDEGYFLGDGNILGYGHKVNVVLATTFGDNSEARSFIVKLVPVQKGNVRLPYY